MTINKLTAGTKGNPFNSKGSEIAATVNALVDVTDGIGTIGGVDAKSIADLREDLSSTGGGDLVNFGTVGVIEDATGSDVAASVNALIDVSSRLSTGTSVSALEPAEDFDRPEGTLLNGIVTKSGHVLSASAPGSATLRVDQGGARSDANVYFGMTSANLVTKVSGAFSYTEGSRGQVVIMFNGGSSPNDLNKLVHLECPRTNVFLTLTETGPTNLSAWTGTVRERSGGVNTDFFLKSIPLDGTPQHVSMEYTKKATALEDVLSVFLPDGRILDYTGDARLRGVMDTCYHCTWQLTGQVSGTDSPRWYNINMGKTREEFRNRFSRSAMITDDPETALARFWRKSKTTIYPTAPGWYEVATQVSESGAYSGLVGTLKVYARSNNGRLNYYEFFVNSYHTAKQKLKLIKSGYGTFGGNAVQSVRISNAGSATGARKLEISVNSYTNNLDYITIEFEGAGVLTKNALVGSTALATAREERLDRRLVETTTEERSTTGKTFVSGIDTKSIYFSVALAGSVDFFLDDNVATDEDVFYFYRESGLAGAAVLKNLSDSSVIATLNGGDKCKVSLFSGLGARNGKFIVSG